MLSFLKESGTIPPRVQGLDFPVRFGFDAAMRTSLTLAFAISCLVLLVVGCRPSQKSYRKLMSGQTAVGGADCFFCKGTGDGPKPYECSHCGGSGQSPEKTCGWQPIPHRKAYTSKPYGRPIHGRIPAGPEDEEEEGYED
jgi:hypothetical protein